MAGSNAHRNVSVDITGDSSSLEEAYNRASRKAKDLDDQLDDGEKKNQNRWANWFASIEGATKAGTSVLQGFSGQAQLITAAVIAGFALLGPASAVTASAITLAFGAALAGIGILAAAESIKVRGEFSAMWQDIKNDIINVSGPIEQSLLKIPGVWRDVVSQFRPHLDDAFAQIAPALDFFIDKFSHGFTSLIPALEPLSAGLNHILLALGMEAPATFAALGDAITTLADTASQHADMFAGLLTGVFQVTDAFANFMDFMAEDFESSMAHWEDAWNSWTGGKMPINLEDSTLQFQRLALIGIETANSLREVSGAMDGASISSAALKTAMDELTGTHITADNANLTYHNTLAKLGKQFELTKGNLDLSTASGRINLDLVLKLAKASNDLLIARADEGAKANELTGIYSTHRATLVEVLKRMGQGQKEAERLADRYLQIPRNINTNIRADASQAQYEVDNFIRTNSGRSIPINVYNKMSQLADGGYMGFPNGGLVRGPGGSRTDSIPARVSRGEYVVNAAATRRHLPLLESINAGRGVGGMGTTVIYQINTTVAPTANLATVGSEIVKSIQAFERGSGRGWRT